MFYNILVFDMSSYMVKIIMLILAYVGMAVFVGGIMVLNIERFALEGFCKELVQKINFEFLSTSHFQRFQFYFIF